MSNYGLEPLRLGAKDCECIRKPACPACNGKEQVACSKCEGGGTCDHCDATCGRCHGAGMVDCDECDDDVCDDCGGCEDKAVWSAILHTVTRTMIPREVQSAVLKYAEKHPTAMIDTAIEFCDNRGVFIVRGPTEKGALAPMVVEELSPANRWVWIPDANAWWTNARKKYAEMR